MSPNPSEPWQNGVAMVLLPLLLAPLLALADPLAISTDTLPAPLAGSPYRARLQARGGTPPLRWEVVGGALPPGLSLNPATGLLSGTPTGEGEFAFAVRVTDSARPPQRQVRSFGARVTTPLAVDWVRFPGLESGGIYGSVRAWNGTSSDLDLTLVVVGVNEYGKAFTLGYQHFPLGRNRTTVEFPFGARLPHGSYTVHADAVGESAPSHSIFRGRRQHPTLRVE